MASAKALEGKVAVVTGASEGIGAAISEGLASNGALVVMGSRNLEKLETVKSRIEKDGGKATVYKTDVRIREEVQSLADFAEATYGPIDILVNNAGVYYYSLMKNLHLAEWDHIVDVNCKGFLNGIAAVLKGMVERKKGHIVAISSESGKVPFPATGVYSGSKFFVEGVCRTLRTEVCKDGVKVTCIQPGDVATTIFDYCYTDPEAVKKYGHSPAAEKVMDPKDIADAVIYVLSQPNHVAVNEILIQPKDTPTL